MQPNPVSKNCLKLTNHFEILLYQAIATQAHVFRQQIYSGAIRCPLTCENMLLNTHDVIKPFLKAIGLTPDMDLFWLLEARYRRYQVKMLPGLSRLIAEKNP